MAKFKSELSPQFIKRYYDKEIKIDVGLKGRNRQESYYRAVFYALCRKLNTASSEEIGKCYNRDHSTVLNGLKVFNKKYNTLGFVFFTNLYRKMLKELIKLTDNEHVLGIGEILDVEEMKEYYENAILDMECKHQQELKFHIGIADRATNNEVIRKLINLRDDQLKLLEPRLEAFLIMNK